MASQPRDLTDTVVAVTGADSGIGAAVKALLLEAGAKVVASSFGSSQAKTVPEKQVLAVPADVRDPAASARLIEAAVERWGRVDSVVACAGTAWFGGILDQDEGQIRMMVETNFLGTVWLSRAAVEHYRARGGGGDVVVVGSVAGLGAGGGQEAVYAASKAAQMQFATSLDREVRHEGIRVAVIAPAAVNTGFAAATGRFGDTPPDQGPFIDPLDIARAVIMTLQQPRTMRTAMWTMWSLAESNG